VSASDLQSRAARAAASLSGYGPMSVDDIRQPEQLVSRLRDPHDTVGAYLRKHFTPEGREQIDRYDDTEPPSPTLLATVVAG
jgi:hypothetical protein